jgi:Domain of unknown function (DUF4345)
MYKLKIVLRTLCVIPLATGVLDFFLGAGALAVVDTALPGEAMADPSLNSQLRFFGAIWFGFGLLLWHVAGDLKTHATWFRLMCFVLILSGIGRLISWVEFGTPAIPFVVATVIEVIVIPFMLFWHFRLSNKA